MWCYGQGKVWQTYTVVNMFGLWLWLELTLPKILTLTLDPNPQNEIVDAESLE